MGVVETNGKYKYLVMAENRKSAEGWAREQGVKLSEMLYASSGRWIEGACGMAVVRLDGCERHRDYDNINSNVEICLRVGHLWNIETTRKESK